MIASAPASAAATYVFEPTLSLTGNCATSGVDPVPDPGPCPGTPEVDHPSAGFRAPSVTTDAYGDVYVVSMLDKESRIDVFSPEGFFISEFKDPAGAQSIAVDKEGNLYLFERLIGGERQVRRFPPSVYKPEEEIEYGEEPVVVLNESTKELFGLGPEASVAVDPATDRLLVDNASMIALFDTAKEENKLLEKEMISGLKRSPAFAVDAVHKKVYVVDEVPISKKSTIRVFELASPHKEVGKINGSTTPQGEFLSAQGFLALDVDDDTGHLFVGDIPTAQKVYEFEEDGTYLATIQHSFEGSSGPGGIPGEIAVDDGTLSPRPETEGWLFVPSGPSSSPGHVYAFKPKEQGPPIVESTSLSGITKTEVVLHAQINPNGLPTEYRLEYVTQQQFEESGFSEAFIAGEATLPKGGEGKPVSAPATELEPGTAYRFRAFAENEEGNDAEEAFFKTFEETEPLPPCPANEAFRKGLSALLPDCRAYELVTPPSTNGRPPTGGFAGVYGFPTLRAAPDGNRASFVIEGGTLPGSEGAGGFNGDPYVSTRGPEGWNSELVGPSGEGTTKPSPGSLSPDQTYSLWSDTSGVYIRYPDGHSELVGRGSLGEAPQAGADLITEGAGHIVFSSDEKLEPNAPPAGTEAVYDRSAAGPTHVVSLLPGDQPQEAGKNAKYLGASEDGEGIAFAIGGKIYVRLHNAETLEAAGPGSEFTGISEEGKRVFYMEGGDLFVYDTQTKATIPFSESGDVTPVNVASGGTRAYLLSPSVLTSEPNPEGEEAKAGKENLYLSKGEGQFSFVGIVTELDVEGEKGPNGQTIGLALWIQSLISSAPAIDPSRTTPSGTTFLFESRADLTGFESQGFAQVYRYDAAEDRLDCLSCSPTATPPTRDASLQSISEQQFSPQPGGSHLMIPNQSPDGKRAFFQTPESLVVGDTDERLDVYEWEGGGVGTCKKPGGCIYLISGGHSPSPDYLFAMSASGGDVFFRTADLLVPRDAESTLSIYDARVGGGFEESQKEEGCASVDTCLPDSTPPPVFSPPGAQTPSEGNPVPACPKGKHKVKRHGKAVCVKNHRKHKHHRRHRNAGTAKKGGSK